MNGSAVSPQRDVFNPSVPDDLAEWLGAVRLTHLSLQAVQTVEGQWGEFQTTPETSGYSFRMLLTLQAYAYARGIFGSNELEERLLTDADLRYLCAREFPDAVALRSFRRRHWSLLRGVLARLIASCVGSTEHDHWFAAEAEADRRLEQAAAADSLALDC
jgi:hypothetical protein